VPDTPTLPGVEVEWDCREECILDFPDTKITLVGIDQNGATHLFDPRCASDIVKNPQMYEDEGLTLHGTHILSDEALRQIFPDDDEVFALTMWAGDCRGQCTPAESILVVGVDSNGGFHLLCVGCAVDILERPDAHDNRGMVLHGTHILSDEVLREVFPEDFTED
jgi:hypothetical protein